MKIYPVVLAVMLLTIISLCGTNRIPNKRCETMCWDRVNHCSLDDAWAGFTEAPCDFPSCPNSDVECIFLTCMESCKSGGKWAKTNKQTNNITKKCMQCIYQLQKLFRRGTWKLFLTSIQHRNMQQRLKTFKRQQFFQTFPNFKNNY